MNKTYFGYAEEDVLKVLHTRSSQTDSNKRIDQTSTLAQLLEMSRSLTERDISYIRKILTSKCVEEEG